MHEMPQIVSHVYHEEKTKRNKTKEKSNRIERPLTVVVPQNPCWLQQVFNGQVFPTDTAYWPHSALALQFDIQPVPQ
jgi:hypothetical protein